MGTYQYYLSDLHAEMLRAGEKARQRREEEIRSACGDVIEGEYQVVDDIEPGELMTGEMGTYNGMTIEEPKCLK